MADEQSGTGAAKQLTTAGQTESPARPRPWWAWFKNIDHILALVAIIAGLVAIVYERKVHHDVDNISKNASTIYLPDWPGHIDDLTNLVSRFRAGDELVIDADVGYTHFTEAEEFNKYFEKLVDVLHDTGHGQRDVRVRMLISDYTTEIEGLNRQFNRNFRRQFDPETRHEQPSELDEFDFNKLWNDPERKKLTDYCNAYTRYNIGQMPFCRNVSDPKAVANLPDFLDVVMKVEDSLISEILSSGRARVRKVHDLNRQRYRWVWIRHRESGMKNDIMEEMIFAYSRFWGPATGKGYGWRTNDGHLIEILVKEFNKDFEDAGPGAELKTTDHPYLKDSEGQKGDRLK